MDESLGRFAIAELVHRELILAEREDPLACCRQIHVDWNLALQAKNLNF